MSTTKLDPYTSTEQNDKATPQEKINDLKTIVKAVKTGMLTTHCANGQLHSRAMTPTASISENPLALYFLANNVSHKFEELKDDPNVNISFYDSDTTNWASYTGKAEIIKDKDVIKKHWSPMVSTYFGDLEDGVHKGNVDDPRISVISVIPDEVRYWVANKGTIGRVIEEGVGAITGRVATPGELRTITKLEVQLAQGLHTK